VTNITVGKKDEMVMKILHYFVTEENYRPIIVNGIQNEIWLENLDNDISLIRININYIHNKEQLFTDLRKANAIRRSIKKKTYSFKMNVLNILVDVRDEVDVVSDKDIESIKINKIGDMKKNKVINEFFPNFKEKVISKTTGVMGMFQMTEELNDKTIREDKKLAKVFKENSTPILTMVLIGTLFGAAVGFGFDAGKQLINNGWDFSEVDWGSAVNSAIVGGALGLSFALGVAYLGPVIAGVAGASGKAALIAFGASSVISFGAATEEWMNGRIPNLGIAMMHGGFVMLEGMISFGVGGITGSVGNVGKKGKMLISKEWWKKLIFGQEFTKPYKILIDLIRNNIYLKEMKLCEIKKIIIIYLIRYV